MFEFLLKISLENLKSVILFSNSTQYAIKSLFNFCPLSFVHYHLLGVRKRKKMKMIPALTPSFCMPTQIVSVKLVAVC